MEEGGATVDPNVSQTAPDDEVQASEAAGAPDTGSAPAPATDATEASDAGDAGPTEPQPEPLAVADGQTASLAAEQHDAAAATQAAAPQGAAEAPAIALDATAGPTAATRSEGDATPAEPEQQAIPDAASMYATGPSTIGAKRALDDANATDANTAAAAAETAATADAAAAPATSTQQAGAAAAAAGTAGPPSPKRQRRTAAPGSWDTVLRVVVPQRRVGLIIGKAGSTITDLQNTTGARIQVVPAMPLCDQRVVVLSSPEIPTAATNGAVSALLGIHRVLSTADPEPPGTPTVVKLLIGRTQAAAVPAPGDTGANGAAAGATVRLLRLKKVPLYALENDRVVEVKGSAEAVGPALAALGARLREHPAMQRPGGPSPALEERIKAARGGGGRLGGPPPPPPPRSQAQPPHQQQHYSRPQQYGAPAAYY